MIHRFILVGACGKMGKEITDVIKNDENAELAGIIEREGHPDINKPCCDLILQSDIGKISSPADCIIDFSSVEGTGKTVEFAISKKIPAVIGTTGFSEVQSEFIKDSSKHIPLLVSPNMSVGVNCLYMLTELASRLLGKEYSREIIEIHHVNKKDAPSGTALKLAEIISRDKSSSIVCGRHGHTGKRKEEEIGIHAVRGGDVVGEHTVLFLSRNDRIELTHRAGSRRIFAEGAVIAAHWLVGKENGLYTMRDVIKS
jgi:4-hydroxy-tetrahydrodipicolinate reductase